MAVMKKMRDLTKIILYILVAAFVGTIIFDWGMNYTGQRAAANVIGKVDGVEISARQFDQAFTRQLEQYRQQTGGDVPESQINFIRNQIWESLVQDVLIQRALQEKEIVAEDQEIVYRLFNAPPEILKSNPSFLDDQQQFDMAKYQAAINDPSTADQWRPVEEYLRQTLPYEKFQQRLQATIRITDDEIKREYLKQNQKVKVEYVFIDPKSFQDNDFEITDEMIRTYYNENKNEFKQEEKRQIEYAIFPTVATAEDSAETQDLANRIMQRALEGEDFGELAEIYSEDSASKDKGGDLGYFARGAMVKEFERAAFAAKEDEIVGPVHSQFGLHVIKVEDKRIKDGDEEVKARHILFKFEPSSKTINKARDNAEFVAEQAKTQPFAELVKEVGDSVQTSGFFVKGSGFIPGIGLNQSASNFIFANKIGDVGNVEQTSQGFFVFRIAGIQQEHIKPLEEVSDVIKNKLLAEKRREKARALAEKIYNEIQNGVSLENAVSQDSLEIKETSPFNRGGFVSGVGRDANFIGAAFALNKVNGISKPIAGTRGYYILKLKEKNEFDLEDYNAKKEQIASQLTQSKQNQVFANWYSDAKAKADIKDYRDKFF